MVVETCATCIHESKTTYEYPCVKCISTEDFDCWEVKEDDVQV